MKRRRVMQDHDPEDFGAYSDTKIATIAAFLHEQGEAAGFAVPTTTAQKKTKTIIPLF
jgi:hypothetical protein